MENLEDVMEDNVENKTTEEVTDTDDLEDTIDYEQMFNDISEQLKALNGKFDAIPFSEITACLRNGNNKDLPIAETTPMAKPSTLY